MNGFTSLILQINKQKTKVAKSAIAGLEPKIFSIQDSLFHKPPRGIPYSKSHHLNLLSTSFAYANDQRFSHRDMKCSLNLTCTKLNLNSV